jgi:hypothetical protein
MAQQDDSGHDEDSSSLVPLPLPSRPPAASGLVPLQNGSPTSSKPATSTPLVIATVGNGSPTTPASSSSFASASSSSALAAPASNSGSNSAQNDDGEAPEADGAMSGHHHYHDGSGGHQHGQPNPYATPPGPAYSASPAVSLSSNPYTSYSPTTVSTQPGDPYRPNAVIGSPISLPSMRTIDASSQQVATSHLSHQSMGLNLNVAPTPVPSSMPFYPHQPMPQAGPYYALPHDPRLLGSRGPKKEIKRRTKTGCLTCRKRRIKVRRSLTFTLSNTTIISDWTCFFFPVLHPKASDPKLHPGTASYSVPTQSQTDWAGGLASDHVWRIARRQSCWHARAVRLYRGARAGRCAHAPTYLNRSPLH